MSSMKTKRWLAKLSELLEAGASEDEIATFLSETTGQPRSFAMEVSIKSLMQMPIYGSRRNAKQRR